MRPTWDEYFSHLATVVATRSTCPRLAVGCVLVRDNRILATGYNGSISGQDHCSDVGCLMVGGHCVRALHSEQNAIIQAALHGISTRSATCYCTHFPCVVCAKMLINAGVERLVYINDYTNAAGDSFFKWAKIQIDKVNYATK